MRLAWLTDIHLNFLRPDQTRSFLATVQETAPDAIAISGDIAEAHDLPYYLELLDDTLQFPIYFVLGNHDYYHGSISEVRARVQEICQQRPRLHYLTQIKEPIALSSSVTLVGHDGWADARLGNYERSLVQMTDWRLIGEFAGHNKLDRRAVLERLGDEAATHLRSQLSIALANFQKVLVVTHVPPLREACWHQGRLSDDQWAPHFTCKAVGDVLLELAGKHPEREIEVYCGHTHGIGDCRPRENLFIDTGGAEYGAPHIQKVLEI